MTDDSVYMSIDVTFVASGWSVVRLLRQVVYNDNGDLVGYVHDAIVMPDGTLSYIIVNVAGFMGIAHKLVALPPSAFTVTDDESVILPLATRDNLDALPDFQYSS